MLSIAISIAVLTPLALLVIDLFSGFGDRRDAPVRAAAALPDSASRPLRIAPGDGMRYRGPAQSLAR